MKLSSAIDDFTREKIPNWSYKTFANYRTTLSRLGRIPGNVQVASLTAAEMHRLVYENHFRARTRDKIYSHLFHFFRWCHDRGYVRRNIMEQVDKPTVNDDIPEIPSESEYLYFLEHCPHPYDKICGLLGSLGPRAGELLRNGPEWHPARYDSQADAIVMNHTKTHRGRLVPLPQNNVLREYLMANITPEGEINFGVSSADVYAVVRAVWRGMKKPFSVKTFRTFAINMMLSRYGQSFQVAKCVGNTEKTINRYYGRINIAQLVPLVNTVKLPETWN